MCGVLAWWRPPSDASFATFTTALHLQRHRGPDMERAADFGEVWLGHNRLSIIDLSERGSQPMTDVSGNYTIVYNGEVYNYIEIRHELEAADSQIHFKSETDTEVVLAAFAKWGADAFERFNGMWSFTIWDAKNKRLTISRDRYGIKPLYFTRAAGGLAFSSEIKPLLQLLQRSPQADRQAIARFFATGNVDGSHQTWFSDIERFPAGATLSIDSSGAEVWTYNEAAHRNAQLRLRGREDEFDALAKDAVKLCLRSDVPVGLCLSGGIDSSLIACLASETQEIESFTSRHREAASDEFQWVETVTQGRKIRSNSVWGDQTEIGDDASKILWHLEEPAKASGVLSQWYVMRAARERGIPVLLDGQGGDEVFGGYAFHRWPYLNGLLFSGQFGDAAEEAAAWGWDNARAAARASILEGVKRPLRRMLAPLRKNSLAQSTPWTDHFLFDELLPELEQAEHLGITDGLHARLDWDVRSEMLPALLRYEDKISMAFSIESRVPLLDHRLVSFAQSLDPRDLIHQGWSKWPLRTVLSRHGAEKVAWRKDKMGFATPMNMYWKKSFDLIIEWLSRGCLAEAGIIEPSRVERVIRNDLDSPHSRLTWHLLQAEWWFRNFIDGDFRKPLAWN